MLVTIGLKLIISQPLELHRSSKRSDALKRVLERSLAADGAQGASLAMVEHH